MRLRILGESVVELGDQNITPESPRLFALALYLGQADGRPIHKSELCDLLFPDANCTERASHNLRQLLYRLRCLGVDVRTVGSRVSLGGSSITSSFDAFAAKPRGERARCRALDLAILPAYEPRISRQFSEWIETVRVREQTRVRTLLQNDFSALEQSCDWDSVISLGRTLQDLQMATGDILAGVAQALALRGQKLEALDLIDSFLEDCPSSATSLRQLRSRIARTERSSTVLESSFHGRRSVMQDLARQWDGTAALVPQLAVVTGPAGIGKTRLAQEFSSYVQLHGGQCLFYRCERSDSARPYAVFRGILPQLRAMRGSLGASPDLRTYLDHLSPDSTLAGALESVASEAMRANIQLALIDLLEAVSLERRLLIVIDDAHLQDSASSLVGSATVASGAKAGIMLIWCRRTFSAEDINADHASRAQLHRLAPLSTGDSVAALSDLLSERQCADSMLLEWAHRAGGNPYYLHAMAHDISMQHCDAPVSFDIQRFAAAAYYALSLDAKTVFETCILLGSLATLPRVIKVAGISGQALLTALRDLEASGMVITQSNTLRSAHALLEEACIGLIPHSVGTLLRTRIATALEEECTIAAYPADLSWAAADHWIAIGEVVSAARLLRRCASQAAALGESAMAAMALLHIPVGQLDLPGQATVLSELAEYSEAATDFPQVSSTLQALRRTTVLMRCPERTVREIDLRITEAELRHGADPMSAVTALQHFISDEHTPSPLRLRAGGALLIIADMDLNESLGKQTYSRIGPDLAACTSADGRWQRAEIVFHTAFGDPERALATVDVLLERNSTPEMGQIAVQHRRNIAYSLMRLGLYDEAKRMLHADYELMSRRHVPSEAAYRMLLLGELAIHEGEFDEARLWIGRLGETVAKHPTFATAIKGGYYSAAAELALHEKDFARARSFADLARRDYPSIRTARYAAVALSMRLRIELGRDGRPASQDAVTSLSSLYGRGGHLGMQDEIVETLWLAATVAGRGADASRLLWEYLTIRRRETGPHRWSLRLTTESDAAWTAYEQRVRSGTQSGRRPLPARSPSPTL